MKLNSFWIVEEESPLTESVYTFTLLPYRREAAGVVEDVAGASGSRCLQRAIVRSMSVGRRIDLAHAFRVRFSTIEEPGGAAASPYGVEN